MQKAIHGMKKALSIWMTALLVCVSTTGCGALLAELSGGTSSTESTVQEENPVPRVRSGAAVRGADLQSISAVGELEEAPPETLSEPEASVEAADDAPEEEIVRSAQEDLPEEVVNAPLMWDLSLLPYRAMLSSGEQAVYDEIYTNIVKLKAQFSLQNYASTEQINEIVHAVYYDNPELFWIDSSYRYGYTADGRITSLTIQFNSAARDFAASKQRFEKAADKIIAGAMNFERDVDREKYVHDVLIQSVEYRLNAPLNQSAYSALVGGQSVCAGYSRAFQYILMKMGIPCYYCVGYAEQDHAWNIVELDGEYYNVDLSWNDPIGNPQQELHYEYFNITDDQIGYDHTREDLSVNLPPCEGTAYSYNNLFPEEPVQAGGAPRECQESGFSEADALTSVEAYYAASKEALLEFGLGEQTQTFLLQDEALRERIFQVISNRGWFDAYVAPAAEEMGMTSCNAEISVSYEPMRDGHVLLTQTLIVTE